MGRKQIFRLIAILLTVSICGIQLLFPQETPRYIALIMDIKGEVLVKKAKRVEFEKALWGMQLYEGDKLKTLKNAELSLLFSDNNLVSLGPNSTITISKSPSSIKKSKKPILNMDNELMADISMLTLRRTSGGDLGALAGLRTGDTEQILELQSPRNSKIKSTQPTFIWNSKGEYDEFRVTLYDSNGPVWTREVKKTQLDYPKNENSLEYGKSYFWHVEGIELFESQKSQNQGFSILTHDEVHKVEEQEKNVKKQFDGQVNNNSYHFILGAYYQKKGLLADAIKKFELISKMNPNAPLPHEILGNIYKKIGLKDMAIAELQKAIKLSQQRE